MDEAVALFLVALAAGLLARAWVRSGEPQDEAANAAVVYATAIQHGVLTYVSLGYDDQGQTAIFFGVRNQAEPKRISMGSEESTVLLYQSVLKASRSKLLKRKKSEKISAGKNEAFVMDVQRMLAEEGLTAPSAIG